MINLPKLLAGFRVSPAVSAVRKRDELSHLTPVKRREARLKAAMTARLRWEIDRAKRNG